MYTANTVLNNSAGPDHRHYRTEWQTEVEYCINVNKFTARLVKTGLHPFSYDWFGLVTMRNALETPLQDMEYRLENAEAWIPAAAAWIMVLGSEMINWDKEYPYG